MRYHVIWQSFWSGAPIFLPSKFMTKWKIVKHITDKKKKQELNWQIKCGPITNKWNVLMWLYVRNINWWCQQTLCKIVKFISRAAGAAGAADVCTAMHKQIKANILLIWIRAFRMNAC